jgi:hypothetical protein
LIGIVPAREQVRKGERGIFRITTEFERFLDGFILIPISEPV